MNTQTKEKLVSLVASGTDTYEQILRAIPELTENALYYVTHNHLEEERLLSQITPTRYSPEEERLLSQITPTRYSPEEEHHFLPDDRFELDDAGKDILYRIQKDTHLLEQQAQAIRYAKLSFIATIIIGIITTLLTGVPLIWRYLFP